MESGEINYPVSILLTNGVFLLAGLIGALIVKQRFNLVWFIVSVALYNVYAALLLNLFGFNGHLYALVGSPDVTFNWAGKLTSIAFTIALLLTPWFDRREAGITLRQSEKAYVGWGVFALLFAINFYVALQLDNDRHGFEAIAYQLTMPSIDEEMFYRGVWLLALIRAFGEGPRILFANLGWGALMCGLIFGVGHSLFWAGEIVFSLENFAITGAIGLLFAWMRLNTGSIVAPLLLHSAINTVWRVI